MANITNNFVFGKNPSLANSRFLINNTNREDSILFNSSKTTRNVLYDEKTRIKSDNISMVQLGDQQYQNKQKISFGYTTVEYEHVSPSSTANLIIAGGTDTSNKYDGLAYSYDGTNFYGVLSENTPTNQVYDIKHALGIWVCMSDNTHSIVYSYDGLNWTGADNKTIYSNNGECVTFGKNIFLSGGYGNTHTMAYGEYGI